MISPLFSLDYIPERSVQSVQQIIASWRMVTPAQVQRIDHQHRCEIAQIQFQAGEIELTRFRIKHLEPIAQQRWPKFRQQTVEFAVVFLGSLAFSTLPQLLAEAISRGSLSLGIGLLCGGAATWLTHDRATQGLAKMRCRHDVLQALESLAQQRRSYPAQNEMADHFFQGQRTRLLQAEGEYLKRPFRADMTLAIAMSLLEVIATFMVVQPVGAWLASLVSLFPVIVIWLAAALQSDCVEFANTSAELVQSYYALLPTDEVSEEQALYIQQLDAAFKYFTRATPDGFKTVAAARAQATGEFAQKRIDHLEAEGIQAVKTCKLEYRQAIANLPDQISRQQEFDVAGYRGFEILPEQQQAAQALAERLATAAAKLSTRLEEDLKMLQTEYNQQIQKWQRIKSWANAQQQVESG
jgi:uncharacterized membrane protein YphA (DoxX/SURF4 family)